MRPAADATVIAWLDRQDAADLYLTSISLAELLVGLQTMPEGRRRATLTVRLDGLLTRLFGTRILPFDMPAARAYAQLAAGSRSRGRMVGLADGQIAAIAFSRGYTVATRDTGPFRAMGVPVIDPWSASG